MPIKKYYDKSFIKFGFTLFWKQIQSFYHMTLGKSYCFQKEISDQLCIKLHSNSYQFPIWVDLNPLKRWLNLFRFVGACLDHSQPFLVTEYCPRGSLQVSLANSIKTWQKAFGVSVQPAMSANDS